MFYRTENPHGLPHDPFKSCVVPRPIGWISTLSEDGAINLAPYSFFNGVAGDPPMVMFATNGQQPHGPKDSASNAEQTGEFVCNMVAWDLREPMSTTSAPLGPDENEFDAAGLEMTPSELVKPPRVKAAPVHLECTYYDTMELPNDKRGGRNAIIAGRVVGIHIADPYLRDGLLDIKQIRPVARMGYKDYTSVTDVFTMLRPSEKS